MSSVPPATVPEVSGNGQRITARIERQGNHSVFQLSCGADTISLLDSLSLNRWTAIGIVQRHKLDISHEGISIDGHQIQYADPQATVELERILNRTEAHSHPIHAPSSQPTHTPPASDLGVAGSFAENVRVTRDGFEFHVIYRTRFGETKTVRLEAALEAFQNMRVFKPHINMQKSGIRLVVTRWDGESFVEEPGIENVEHASPDEVEALIRSQLLGGLPLGAEPVGAHGFTPRGRAPIVRLALVKKPQDARFHFVFHRANGTVEDGPVLIRVNLAKLVADGLFAPGVSISMTAMNDRFILTRKPRQPSDAAPTSEIFPITTAEEAQRVESVLNECLAPSELEPLGTAGSAASPPAPKHSEPIARSAAPVPSKPNAPEPRLGDLVAAPSHGETSPASSKLSTPAAHGVAEPPPVIKPQSLLPNWMVQALERSASMPFTEVNAEVFNALHKAWGALLVTNEHDFPAVTLDVAANDSTVSGVEVVLAPHYLLFRFALGYLRFGAETRVFLNRLDDFIAFPHEALRGVQRRKPSGFTLIVSSEFRDFLQRQTDRSYRTHFQEFLADVLTADPVGELLWPVSREEKLFQLVSKTALSYGLPITSATVVLDPAASEFIGFKETPYGIEFRDGPEFVRFAPDAVELSEDGESHRFEVADVLLGWALDSQGRVCACYRKESGFVPPQETKLLRFLDQDERERERSTLTFLAELGPDAA